MDLGAVTHVVLGGGGLRGFCYLGALTALADSLQTGGDSLDAFTRRLEVCAGTSIGCMFALVLVLGLPVSSLNVLRRSDGAVARDVLPRPSAASLAQGALDTGASLRLMVARLLSEANFTDRITMGELRRRTGKRLVCTVCNVLTMRAEYLDADTAPWMLVVDAVAASMRVPMVYTAHADAEHQMVLTDGGGVDNFPLAAAAEVPTERVLGMRSWPNTEPVVFDPHAVHGRTYLARALMSPLVALESVQFAAHPAALQARVVTFGTEGVSGAEFYAGPEVCRALWWTGLWTMYQAIDPARGAVLNVVVSALAVHLTARRGALVERALARTMRQARLPRADEAAPVGITSLET
jgi:predicted acylesterase/phospholipase RssA